VEMDDPPPKFGRELRAFGKLLVYLVAILVILSLVAAIMIRSGYLHAD
jgi:hypothetical protein